MYDIYYYNLMLADRVRSDAYYAGLRHAVKPGDVVVDLGAGIGIWGLAAAKLGARKVYCIDFNHLIHVGKQAAVANGVADRMEFIQDFSTNVTLPEKADVIIFDLHGQLPFCLDGPAALMDARDRFLKPGGKLVPERDRVYGALAETPTDYDLRVSFWDAPQYGVDMKAAKPFATDWFYSHRVTPKELISKRVLYAEWDYYTLATSDHAATMEFTAQRHGQAHGLQLWFESQMFGTPATGGVTLSNDPSGPDTIFGRTFIPFTEPLALEAGDQISLMLKMKNWKYQYLFESHTVVTGAGGACKAEFRQSSLRHALPRLVGANAEVLKKEE